MRRLGWIVVSLALWAAACSDSREQLLRELQNPSPVIRAGAVKSLGKQGDDEAYTLVAAALNDRSAVVRIAAVWALADFQKRDTTAALVRASRDADPEVREAVVTMMLRRGGDTARTTLVEMLLRGESNTNLRRLIYDGLEQLGLTGERLTGEMAETQLGRLQEQLAKGSSQVKVEAVRAAGRSVHPGGIDLVLQGLADENQDVVLAALRVLDGRGGQPAMDRLQLLLADPAEEVRLAALDALVPFGGAGRKLALSCLRDAESQVRLRALEIMDAEDDSPPSVVLCPLLLDTDVAVALASAGVVRRQGLTCELLPFGAALAAAPAEDHRRLVAVLSAVGGAEAVKLLAAEARREGADTALLMAAAARAGDRRPEIGRLLAVELERTLTDGERLAQSWVAGKLPPIAESADEPSPEVDRARLSEEEMQRLYNKHGLGPVSDTAPRGVSDLLAGFKERERPDAAAEFFEPVDAEVLDRQAALLDGLLLVDPTHGGALTDRLLGWGRTAATARVARVLLAHDTELGQLADRTEMFGRALREATLEQLQPIVKLLVLSRQAAAAGLLAAALPEAGWEKRDVLIAGLGKLKDASVVDALLGQLKGYSAIPAARALAAIGDRRAVEPMQAALQGVGPMEEVELLAALARLGCREILPRLTDKLAAADPDVRRAAVRILGELGGPEAIHALQGARFDLDRLVRRDVQAALERGERGESTDATRPDTQAEGRGGGAATPGQTREGSGAVPEGSRTRSH